MIGILGGSFDPVHFGHLRPALELQQDLGLQQVRLIPSGTPPHRQPPVANSTQRLAMLRLAIENAPGLSIDAREIGRTGPSYTVDTLTALRTELGDSMPLCLIIGMDAFRKLHTWRRWRELLTLAHIVVAQRPGNSGEFDAEIAQLLDGHQISEPHLLTGQAAGHILFQPVTQLDISSSQIRDLLSQGKSVRYLLPDAVENMIKVHGIYPTPCSHDLTHYAQETHE